MSQRYSSTQWAGYGREGENVEFAKKCADKNDIIVHFGDYLIRV